MSSPAENAALITLLRSGARPWRAYAEIVEEAGSAVAVLEQERSGRLFGEDDLGRGDTVGELERWSERGMRLLTVLDADYPENLRAVHDRPPLVFVAGALREGDGRSIAVIGSRAASRPGLGAARTLAAGLVDDGFTVFSGLAAGIDTAAHEAALARGGRTVAVIGTGLAHSYPPQNTRLQRRIGERCAVVSQFWPDAPPSRRSFPMRNAVMSGMTLGSVVVEASPTSGARLQARLALAQGRPVFLLESLLAQPWAREFAVRPGVRVVNRSEQITAAIERLISPDSLVG
jgi:DNA processing protein